MNPLIDNNSPPLQMDQCISRVPTATEKIQEQPFEPAKVDLKSKQSRWKKLILPVAIVAVAAGVAAYYFSNSVFGGVIPKDAIPCGSGGPLSTRRFPRVACREDRIAFTIANKNKNGDPIDWKKAEVESSVLYQRCLAGNVPLHFKFYNGDDYIYQGGLEKGIAKGEGTLTGYNKETHALKDFYKGSFDDGFPEGVGAYTRGHSKFVGNFVKGKFSGPGVYEGPNKRIEGTFENDQLIDKAKMTIIYNGKKENFDLTFGEPYQLISANYHAPSGKIYPLDIRSDNFGRLDKRSMENLGETAKLIRNDMSFIERFFGDKEWQINWTLLNVREYRIFRFSDIH